MENILLIDKPKGITSFDVIRQLRKKLGGRKMGHARSTGAGRHGRLKIGHAGTLDPAATGLLIVGVGEGVKKLKDLLKLPKTYEVEILLGVATDTGDLDGRILEEQSVEDVAREDTQKVLESLEGIQELPVPAYSAIKRGGEPLYKKARRGEVFELPKKKMEIRRILLREMRREGDKLVLVVEMEVGSGTYVRSIAEEIGRRLHVPATVKELRRTKIGDFDVKEAQKLDEI